MKKKKKKIKRTAFPRNSNCDSRNSKHEDVALKVTAQFFRDEIMPALAIDGKVVEILSTESIHLDLKKGYEDFNFLMEDGTIKHFEFQSANKGLTDLKRFRMYEALLSYQHKKKVTTYVLFSGKIKNPMTEFTEVIQKVEAVIYIMADKFLDSAEMKQLKEEIKLTRLGQMLYEDGKEDGVIIGEERGEKRGEKRGEAKMMKLIQCMTNDGGLELIPKLTTDTAFYKDMVKKYHLE